MQGVWFDPRHPGCGFTVNSVNGGAQVGVTFYGHGNFAQPLWLVAAGDPGRQLQLVHGRGTGFPTTAVEYEIVGTVQMSPSDNPGRLRIDMQVKTRLVTPLDFSPPPPDGHMTSHSFDCVQL